VITLTTVGYGDYYPVTGIGKLIAAVIAILGIGMFALPAGILGAGFVDELQNRDKTTRLCPHCGEELK
jgi:voltage-gated potassium channel